MKTIECNILDGSLEYQNKMVDKYSDALSDEEKKLAMSDEFAYLDDDED